MFLCFLSIFLSIFYFLFLSFNKIKRYFNSNKVMWIPEVWNGHLDNFKGFEDALIKINKI